MPVFSESWLDNLNKRQADEMSLKDPQKLESVFFYMLLKSQKNGNVFLIL